MSASAGAEAEVAPLGEVNGALSADQGLSLTLTQKIPARLGHVWEVLVSVEGSAALLGEGAVLATKGEPYHCADGTGGVLRSFHPLEQIRVSFHPTPDSPPSIIEVDLRADPEDPVSSTVIDFRHDRIPDDTARQALRERWSAGLRALASLATA